MIYEDVKKYAEENWESYLKSVTESSRPDNGKSPLVEDDTQFYCFDDITKAMFREDNKPSSVDSINFFNEEIQFIEFKSGFVDEITRENYTMDERSKCEKAGNIICNDYWGRFFKLREKEKKELIYILRLKAWESYHLFDKLILPYCDNTDIPKVTHLIIVIDGDSVETTKNILDDLASKKKNPISIAKEAILSNFKRLDKSKNIKEGYFLFDKIDVFSATEYKSMLKMQNGILHKNVMS